MRICILGAKGTLGAVLTEQLNSTYSVTPITRNQVDLLNIKAVDDYFSNNAFDVVINCAINSYSHLDASPKVASDNLTLFANIYAHRTKFGRVIHFCSGAEFDTRYDITNAKEETLFISAPTDPYGVSKNATARISYYTDNFYNLRLFGAYYATELPRRLLPRILSGESINIVDKYFDYVYLEDLVPLVKYYANTPVPRYKDINVVYNLKTKLSTFIKEFIEVNKLQLNIPVTSTQGLNYTGDGTKWAELDLPLIGQTEGLKRYFTHWHDRI